MEITVSRSRNRSRYGEPLFDVMLNGQKAEFLPHAEGARAKYQVKVDGKMYFIKADSAQTEKEIQLLNAIDPEDEPYFIFPVAIGHEGNYSFIVQEFVDIIEPDTIECDGDKYYEEIRQIARKYNLTWDLSLFKNWGLVEGQPVLYDAVPDFESCEWL